MGLGGLLRPRVKSPAPPPPLPSSRPITSPTRSSLADVERGYDLDDDGTSSQLPGGMSVNRSVGKSSVVMGKSDVGDDDIEESQLFPGSDLF